MSTKIADTFPCFLFPVIKTFAINMFWLNIHQMAYIDKLIVFPLPYRLFFPVVVPDESISELKVNT